jgi:hypothetical protein
MTGNAPRHSEAAPSPLAAQAALTQGRHAGSLIADAFAWSAKIAAGALLGGIFLVVGITFGRVLFATSCAVLSRAGGFGG